MNPKMLSISLANIDALQEAVEVAKSTGTVDHGALVAIAEAVRREVWMNSCFDYLETKEITPIERSRVAQCMQTMQRSDERALGEIAAPYKRGDIKQMIDALEGKPLKRNEVRVVDHAERELQRIYTDETNRYWVKLAEILERHDVKVSLHTVRLQRGRQC